MTCFNPQPSIAFTQMRQVPRFSYKEPLSNHKHVSVGTPLYILIYRIITGPNKY